MPWATRRRWAVGATRALLVVAVTMLTACSAAIKESEIPSNPAATVAPATAPLPPATTRGTGTLRGYGIYVRLNRDPPRHPGTDVALQLRLNGELPEDPIGSESKRRHCYSEAIALENYQFDSISRHRGAIVRVTALALSTRAGPTGKLEADVNLRIHLPQRQNSRSPPPYPGELGCR
jgi:hypothetical protein